MGSQDLLAEQALSVVRPSLPRRIGAAQGDVGALEAALDQLGHPLCVPGALPVRGRRGAI